ncbi:thiosulfate:glutathione sulfurtransferase [Sarotherodon galilaeus]
MESSQGIYKPIRVLFNTPIYETAVKICWYLPGYRTQIAIMMEFLRLQQEDLIPPTVTAEDLRDLLVEKSRETLREQLWEFELEDFEEEEAKPLLRLVWAVNVINKMRDVEFQARMLLQFPEAIPPKFQTPKLLSIVKDYVEILKKKQLQQHNTKLLTAQEVVIEVVPRVLQGFWELPPRPLLNMASQTLSILSTSVTKATLDRVSKSLTAKETQAIFTRSIRDNMVDSILTEIRKKFPQEILSIKISNFAPVLLKTIADVAMIHISEMFEPLSTLPDVKNKNEERSSDGLATANVPPAEGSFSEHVPVPDVLCEELPAERASNLSSQDLKIEGPLSESVPEPDVPGKELLAVSSSSTKPEDLTSKGPLSESVAVAEVPCEELPAERASSLSSQDLKIEGPLSESVPEPDVPGKELLAVSSSSTKPEDLTIKGPLSESVAVADLPCEEPFAESESSLNSEDLKIKGSLPCEEPFPEPSMKSKDLQINKKKKKKGFFKRLQSLFCCCCRPKVTD